MPLTNAQKQARARDKRKRVAAQTAQTLERYRGALEAIAGGDSFHAGDHVDIARQALTPHEMEGK